MPQGTARPSRSENRQRSESAAVSTSHGTAKTRSNHPVRSPVQSSSPSRANTWTECRRLPERQLQPARSAAARQPRQAVVIAAPHRRSRALRPGGFESPACEGRSASITPERVPRPIDSVPRPPRTVCTRAPTVRPRHPGNASLISVTWLRRRTQTTTSSRNAAVSSGYLHDECRGVMPRKTPALRIEDGAGPVG
jgi:hypothetical protein